MNKVDLYLYAKERLEQGAKEHKIDIEKYYCPECSGSSNYFKAFCGLFPDRQYMKNIIKWCICGSKTDEVLSDRLFKFDAEKTYQEYVESAKSLFDSLANDPRIDVLHNEKYWEEYADAICQCASYLCRSEYRRDDHTITLAPIADLLKPPTNTDDLKAILFNIRPLYENMRGMGAAVCSNWLKECGAVWLAKPDLHIKRVIAELLKKEMSSSETDSDKVISSYLRKHSDLKRFPFATRKRLSKDEFASVYMYQWAEDIRKSGKETNVTAFKLDRVIFLYCTGGKFYSDDGEPNCRNMGISEEDLISRIYE